MFDSILTTSTLILTNETQNLISTTTSTTSSIKSLTLNRTNKPNYVVVVASTSHRTKTILDSRMVNHSGDHFTSKSLLLLLLLFIFTVFHLIK